MYVNSLWSIEPSLFMLQNLSASFLKYELYIFKKKLGIARSELCSDLILQTNSDLDRIGY